MSRPGRGVPPGAPAIARTLLRHCRREGAPVMPYADPDKRRRLDRERHRRRAAERAARGLCPRCGTRPTAPERRLCAECADRKRAAERSRYAAGKAAGKLYGGRRVATRRRDSRERGRERQRARRKAGLCTACGRLPPAEGAALCEGCRSIRRARERERYARRKAACCCVRCREPVPAGASRCRRCAAREAARPKERKNASDRKRYARRRARKLCTKCGINWAGSAAQCEPCSQRSRARAPDFRGLPATEPRFTIVETASGLELDTFQTEAEAMASLVFAGLNPEEVELVADVYSIAAPT